MYAYFLGKMVKMASFNRERVRFGDWVNTSKERNGQDKEQVGFFDSMQT
jgi:hypothetical protein